VGTFMLATKAGDTAVTRTTAGLDVATSMAPSDAKEPM
jgi:hypothetical protein